MSFVVRAAIVWILPLGHLFSGEAGERDTAATWTRWEHALTGAGDYPNPYASPTVSVTYRGPGGESIKGYGFWDGGRTFKIRCMFSRPGTWTWRTACSNLSDAGLHDRSGSIEVAPYQGDNVLFRRGYLRVEPGRQHIAHADGTPFLWIGDTAWAMPMFASFEEWQTYVNDRRDKRFSVIQIFCASEWAGKKDAQGNAPFVGEGLERWNPAYWQAYERKVAYANQQGLVVTIVGLMEPVKRYPEEGPAKLFARNLAARLVGDFVIFSPSFDSVYKELGDAVALAARDAAPFHLITQHPGTNLPAAVTYHGTSMLDVAGLQSGAGWGSTPLSPATASRNAIEWTLKLHGLEPRRPVVNLEARYDSEFNQGQLPRMPRSCGYLTFLSGAAGYTYGCAGVWNGGTAFVGKDPQASAWDWRKGIAQPSSTEMKHMATLFGGIEWWRLEPRHDLIANQEKDWLRRMVLAATAEGDLAVAYLPDNASIKIVTGGFPRAMRPRWFNPAHGSTIVGEKPATPLAGPIAFDRPAGWGDAVLVVEAER